MHPPIRKARQTVLLRRQSALLRHYVLIIVPPYRHLVHKRGKKYSKFPKQSLLPPASQCRTEAAVYQEASMGNDPVPKGQKQ